MGKKPKRKIGSTQIADPAAFRRALFSKRGSIRAALPTVRRQTPASIIAECVASCLAVPAYRAAFVQAPFPTSFSGIKPLRPFLPVSREFDFEWTSVILEYYSDQLNDYVKLRDQFYDRLLLDEHDDATRILDVIQSKFGASLWLIGARIAVLQESKGVTAQKEFLEWLLDEIGLNVLVGTFSFYSSFSAEEHVSKSELDRELDGMAGAIGHLDIFEYFRYHTNPLDLPKKPYVVVALEENAPIIDRFETFIEMAQLEVAREKNLADLAFVGRAISRVANVSDIRVKNLCFLFSLKPDMLERDPVFLMACDKYTLGKYDEVTTIANEQMAASPGKAWWYDLAVRGAMKRSLGKFNGADYGEHFLGRILVELDRQRALSGDVEQTGFRIQKLMLLSRRMPASRYLASVDSAAMPMLVRDDLSLGQWLWILSSPLDNPLHLRQLHKLAPDAVSIIQAAAQNSPTMKIATAALAGTPPSTDLALPMDRRSQFNGHAAINRREPSEALVHYNDFRERAVGADKLRGLTLIYAAQRAAGSYDDALPLFADAYLHESEVLRIIPLPDFAEWIAGGQGIDGLSLYASIILHAYASLYGSEHDGDLSDAYENTLDYYHAQCPSSLLDLDHGISPRSLVYFIRHVCTITRMEDSTAFDDIDEIESERVQLLQWLIGADQDHAGIYIAEIKAITKDQAVASMSAHLERSKIYVNEEVVRRSFDAEMRYSFARFRELLIEPDLEIRAEAIELRIRKLLKDAESELRDVKLPSTERDGLLRSMFVIALQEFLVYPNGGLKTYLSTRILHGALEGEMRSNLARAQLLFPREVVDAVEEFERAWSHPLAALEPAAFLKARDAVIRFSTRFSENLLELINEKVRIRLSTTPHGLLAYDSKDERMQTLQIEVSNIERYDDFISALFEDFWNQTEVGLDDVKKEIGEIFAKKVESALDALATSVEQLGEEARELLNVIIQARTDFALSVQRVSSWFARSGSLPQEPFKLDVAIETAIRITNNCFPGSEVSSTFDGEASSDLPGEWLNPIVDLFCNCFQNVVEHGGHTGPQEIELNIVEQPDGHSIIMKNHLGEAIDRDERAAYIAEMLSKAYNEDHRRANEEFGSGFSKIVRIMKYDIPAGGSFDISVTTERDVLVRILIAGEKVQ